MKGSAAHKDSGRFRAEAPAEGESVLRLTRGGVKAAGCARFRPAHAKGRAMAVPEGHSGETRSKMRVDDETVAQKVGRGTGGVCEVGGVPVS